MKILILGHTGMLGSMILKYFNSLNLEVVTTSHRYPTESFFQFIKSFDGQFIINCIASIPQRTDDFKINSDLPIWLNNNSPCRVIHPGTDCEPDLCPYGISKKIASDYIKLYSKNTKIIMTSVIGYENQTKYSLLEWFLDQSGEVEGYSNAIWNGVTTLEWAKHAYSLMLNWDNSDILTVLYSDKVSKFDLLHMFREIHNKDIKIKSVNKGHDRSLNGTLKVKSIREQLIEMKYFLGR